MRAWVCREQRKVTIICFYIIGAEQGGGGAFVLGRTNDDAPRSLTSCVLRNSCSDLDGGHLILRAPDYIIQLQNEDFHVYFRENLLFNKGGFSVRPSCSALPYFTVNEQNFVGKISPCDVNQPLPFGFVLFFFVFRSLPLRLKHTEGCCSPPEAPEAAVKVHTGRQTARWGGGARLRAMTQTQKQRRCYISKHQ